MLYALLIVMRSMFNIFSITYIRSLEEDSLLFSVYFSPCHFLTYELLLVDGKENYGWWIM
jgi:hypothetical protein